VVSATPPSPFVLPFPFYVFFGGSIFWRRIAGTPRKWLLFRFRFFSDLRPAPAGLCEKLLSSLVLFFPLPYSFLRPIPRFYPLGILTGYAGSIWRGSISGIHLGVRSYLALPTSFLLDFRRFFSYTSCNFYCSCAQPDCMCCGSSADPYSFLFPPAISFIFSACVGCYVSD